MASSQASAQLDEAPRGAEEDRGETAVDDVAHGFSNDADCTARAINTRLGMRRSELGNG